MGARVARLFRNFNLENRVHREISREKPLTAPRHPGNTPTSANMPNGECPLTVRGHNRHGTCMLFFKTTENHLSGVQSEIIDQSAAVLSSVADPVSGKNEPLLSLLQSVYVESTDPPAAAAQVRSGRAAASFWTPQVHNCSIVASVYFSQVGTLLMKPYFNQTF